MAALSPGDQLGDRFEILGVVGRGGSATVYLATDTLRNERVALKVVHAHLSADPGVRKRLMREVQSATVIRCDAALVPNDLHELDGRLALSMPFHPGEALDAHVAARGALPVETVRAIGIRVARALVEAHRAGVLHRDVSAANILVSDKADDTVLTDFGLARLRHGTGTRSTAMLGTAGYAAPEVYGGDRADPRSDLYGLGSALYLALTGRAAFSATDPMSALRQQLDDGFTPVRELRPDAPAHLAELVESLLRAEPDARPPGAREVLDLLEQRAAPTTALARDPVVRQYLPPGQWTLVLKETDEDAGRRKTLRADRLQGADTFETDMQRMFEKFGKAWRKFIGLPENRGPTPEQVLAYAVAEEAGLSANALQLPGVLYQRRFRLVDQTDQETVQRLAETARAAGFRAKSVMVGTPESWPDWLAAYFWVPIAVGWSTFWVLGDLAALMVPVMIAMSIVLPIWANARGRRDPRAAEFPIAFRADLRGSLTDREHPPPRYAVGVTEGAPDPQAAPAPSSRGDALLQRVEAALASLESTVSDAALQIPEVAQRDLRSTARELRESATSLAREVDQLEGALQRQGAPEQEVALLRARLDRLLTLQRAGDSVEIDEIASLERSIAEHDADLATEARVEARLASSTAQLLEIASTASKVHRTLLVDADNEATSESVDRLQREVEATRRARQEAASRGAINLQ